MKTLTLALFTMLTYGSVFANDTQPIDFSNGTKYDVLVKEYETSAAPAIIEDFGARKIDRTFRKDLQLKQNCVYVQKSSPDKLIPFEFEKTGRVISAGQPRQVFKGHPRIVIPGKPAHYEGGNGPLFPGKFVPAVPRKVIPAERDVVIPEKPQISQITVSLKDYYADERYSNDSSKSEFIIKMAKVKHDPLDLTSDHEFTMNVRKKSDLLFFKIKGNPEKIESAGYCYYVSENH